MESWLTFISSRGAELADKIVEHLFLTGFSTLAAVLAGIPLGIWLARRPAIKGIGMSIIGVLQTIPGLAMLALLLPFLGIGVLPALVALILYALLPIVRNTLTGIENIAPEHIEAADALGLTSAQKMRIVILPLALPTIIAGVRTAAVIGVGVATLATFIGAGGLGDFINRGLATNSSALVLLGAVPAALLAILIDFSIQRVELRVSPTSARHHNRRTQTFSARRYTLAGLALAGILVILAGVARAPAEDVVRIGSKNFTEQFILAEILAQLIEDKTDLSVKRRFNLGSIAILHEALLNDEIDIYPEYTGTAYRVIMKMTDNPGTEAIYDRVKTHYNSEYDLAWLPPFGFNNTYAIATRKAFARERGISTISDLQASAPQMNIGFMSEFFERPDGYAGFVSTYDLEFGETTEMDMALLYKATRDGNIDVLSGNTTDGRIPAYDLVVLEDDRSYFPPYYPAPIVRNELLERYPELMELMQSIAGSISEETMQRLNYEVDELGNSPRDVAKRFLSSF